MLTRTDIRRDLTALGIQPGDSVMVHAAISKVGPVLGGPDTVIAALRDAVGPKGTLLGYADWGVDFDALLDDEGRVPDAWRDHIPVFDPAASRAARDNGVFPEFLRTTPGALRSGNPGASVVALGAKAKHFTAEHPLNYGYGAGTPLARLVEEGGKVLMLGAPLDAMTLLHHAEHIAPVSGKRLRRYEAPLRNGDGVRWSMIEEFDTGEPVLDGLPAEYFGDIVEQYLDTGKGRRSKVGAADCVLVSAPEITEFGVAWLQRYASAQASAPDT
ncbi:MAG: aminoglycoside 3-N-acetyltransferase [Pseudomonadota bacterium]